MSSHCMHIHTQWCDPTCVSGWVWRNHTKAVCMHEVYLLQTKRNKVSLVKDRSKIQAWQWWKLAETPLTVYENHTINYSIHDLFTKMPYTWLRTKALLFNHQAFLLTHNQVQNYNGEIPKRCQSKEFPHKILCETSYILESNFREVSLGDEIWTMMSSCIRPICLHLISFSSIHSLRWLLEGNHPKEIIIICSITGKSLIADWRMTQITN